MTEQEQQQQKLEQMNAEKNDLEATHPLAAKLLETEIARIQAGGLENVNFIELHQAKTKVEFRVKIPSKEFPQLNFVGKILGQGGENVKRLQEATGVRIAVLGWGSMKDKKKQEELRQQGGKYAHLNHDLHVWFEAQGHPIDCYSRIVNAFRLVHPFLVPDPNEMQQLQQQNGSGMMQGGGRGAPRGGPRGAGRGGMAGPPGMGGGRGGMNPMGRGGAGPMRGAAAGRGAPPPAMLGGNFGGGVRPPMRGRGGPPARGATRGSGPNGRGASAAPMGRGRGAPAAPPNMMQQSYGADSYDYEGQGAQGYGGGYGEDMNASYDNQMADPNYGVAPSDPNDQYQYESYGQADESAGYGNYAEAGGWGSDGMGDSAGYGKAAAPSRGGLANYRTRPY